MRWVLQGIGICFLVFSLLFFLLAIASGPPEGLFFGLPTGEEGGHA
jgi:hypothetical protein